jgi:hypothetical protein
LIIRQFPVSRCLLARIVLYLLFETVNHVDEMEKLCMVISLNADTVEAEISQSAIPVLLAWIHPDADRKPYQELLERVAASFPNRMRICLLQKDINGAFGKKHGIIGTPTFLLMQAGCVTKRLLGEVDPSTLIAFIAQGVGREQQVSA